MAWNIDFLTTRGIGDAIEKIINNATDEIVLVSPFIDLPNGIFERLVQADQRGVSITILYGKSELSKEVSNRLERLQNLSLYYDPVLHAKCYYNEDAMVIASMNLYNFSERNNHEIGVWVWKKDGVYSEAKQEIELFISSAQLIRKPATSSFAKGVLRSVLDKAHLFTDNSSVTHSEKEAVDLGYCIRCGNRIRHDPKTPFCTDCYKKWAQYKNDRFVEKYSHSCGSSHRTSYARPQCRSCYQYA